MKSKSQKASFKHTRPKRGLKAPNVASPVASPVEGSEYRGYDVSMLPKEALPDLTRTNLGRHSYTLRKDDSCVEVLLQKEAFFVKKIGIRGEGPTGQVSWSKHGGPCGAWRVAKQRSGFERWGESGSS